MRNPFKAAMGVSLAGAAATLIIGYANAQSLSFNTLIALGESELNAGMYDQARSDLTQAFQIAKRNNDVGNLLRLTQDFNMILIRSNPPSYYVSSYEADVIGAYVTALDAARNKACYDPDIPGSGNNVAGGQDDLRGVIGLFRNLFGDPTPAASGLRGTLSGLEIAAQNYLSESLSGSPACRPAPSPTPAAAAPTAPPAPVGPIVPAPAPTNTSGATPAPTNTSGAEPSPKNTSEPAPAPTNTSGAAPAPTNTSGAGPNVAPTSATMR